MKYTITFWTVFVLTLFVNYGCKDKVKKDAAGEVIKMDSLVNTILINHPNYKNNDIVMSEVNDEFKKIVPLIISDIKYMDDYLLNIFRVSENPNGKGYIVHMNTDEHDKKINVNFDVICMTNDKTYAASIEKRKQYKIPSCKKIVIISPDMLKSMSSPEWKFTSHHAPEIYLKKRYMNIHASLGVLLCS